VLSAGTFRPLRALNLLNLADLPPIPSVFDTERHGMIHSLRFLHAFAADISQPIARDGREHIEYVPTQIVTEYFRRVFRLIDGSSLDGIIYPAREPQVRRRSCSSAKTINASTRRTIPGTVRCFASSL